MPEWTSDRVNIPQSESVNRFIYLFEEEEEEEEEEKEQRVFL